MKDKLKEWLDSGEYLPEKFRDFHEQKDLFKTIHTLYQDNLGAEEKPDWMTGHVYVVDWFLYYMASRGYTLQKCRRDVEFKEHTVHK